ncbi:MAG: HEAT repeat domain-containing protein [Planctomycetota bacterium]|nr:HEAT repeat domain-containing protein [Planctomycetota bacterium]
MSSLSCNQVRERLGLILFKELHPQILGQARTHIQSCSSCQTEFEEVKQTVLALRLDRNIDADPKRIERVLNDVRPSFSARAGRHLLGPEGSRRISPGALGTKLLMLFVPLLGVAAIAFLLDLGGIQSILLPPALPSSEPPKTAKTSSPASTPDPNRAETSHPKRPEKIPSSTEIDLTSEIHTVLTELTERIQNRNPQEGDPLQIPEEWGSREDLNRLRAHPKKSLRSIRALPDQEPAHIAAKVLLISSLLPSPPTAQESGSVLQRGQSSSHPIVILAVAESCARWNIRSRPFLEVIARTLLSASPTNLGIKVRLAELLPDLHDDGDLLGLERLITSPAHPVLTAAMVKAFSSMPIPSVERVFRDLLDRPNPAIQIASFSILLNILESQPRIDLLQGHLRPIADPTIRAQIVQLIGELEDEQLTTYLAQEVIPYESSIKVRSAALKSLPQILGTLGRDPIEIMELRDSSEHPDVRATSAVLLFRSGHNEVVSDLIAELSSGNDQQRQGAALALGNILQQAPEATSALIAALEDPNVNVRFHAIRALGSDPPPQSIDRFRALALSNSEPVRLRAASALAWARLTGPIDSLELPEGIVEIAIEEALNMPAPPNLIRFHLHTHGSADSQGRHLLKGTPEEALRSFESHFKISVRRDTNSIVTDRCGRTITGFFNPSGTVADFLRAVLEPAELQLQQRGAFLQIQTRE